jgi:hypothetical protein
MREIFIKIDKIIDLKQSTKENEKELILIYQIVL